MATQQEKRQAKAFWSHYRPLKLNQHGDWHFDTVGKDLDTIKEIAKKSPKHIWTLVDGEGPRIYALAGFHAVNRLGYMVTEIPWVTGDEDFLI